MRLSISVSSLADRIRLSPLKTIEGRTNRPNCSSPFSEQDRCVLDPLVNPKNTLLVASQTRLDESRTAWDAGHVLSRFGLNIIASLQTPCRDLVVMSS